MTRIHVDTGALLAGAARAQRTSREAAEHARSVQSVLGSLDFEVRARGNIDQRVAAVSRSINVNAQDLQRHAAFLIQAASRYENADQSVMRAVRDFSGRHPSESGGDWIGRVFSDLWRGLTSLLAVVDAKLLGMVFSSFLKMIDVVKDAVKLYAEVFNEHVNVQALAGLMHGGWLSPKALAWATRFQYGFRAFGRVATVAMAVVDGVTEFAESTGSLVRRVSNGVVVGGAKALGGIAGAKVGMLVGLKAGAVVGSCFGPGPGTAVGAVAGVAIGLVGGIAVSWAAEQLVNYEVDGKSIKSVIGDAVETGAKHVQSTAIEIGRSSVALGESVIQAASNVLKTAAPLMSPAVSGLQAAGGGGR